MSLSVMQEYSSRWRIEEGPIMRISKVAAVLVGAGAVFAALGLLVGPTATAME